MDRRRAHVAAVLLVTLKVVSYNILMGGENRLTRIAQVIASQRADVVALLEANRRENAENLAERLGMQLVFGETNGVFHVAWLSALPVFRWENHRLAELSKTLLEVEVPWGGQTARLFATHLGSRHDTQRPPDEVRAILQVLRPLEGLPHLLVGDFNALHPRDRVGEPPPGVQWRDTAENDPREAVGLLLRAGYADCYRALHPRAAGYTYEAIHPWLRLDYVFASPAMAGGLLECGVVRHSQGRRASDHLPVYALFGDDPGVCLSEPAASAVSNSTLSF